MENWSIGKRIGACEVFQKARLNNASNSELTVLPTLHYSSTP